ncbi:MAG: outer membrane beta-barrel protein [Steroidobacteraceae bacterium]
MLHQWPKCCFKIETSLFDVSVLGLLPLNEQFSLFARLGYGSWEIDAKGPGGKDDDEDLVYGLGAAFNVGQLQIRAEWQAIDVSHGSVDYIGVSGAYRFAL